MNEKFCTVLELKASKLFLNSRTITKYIPQRHSEPMILSTILDSKTPLRLVLTSPGFKHRDGEGKQ
jgi:hypothetical protein